VPDAEQGNDENGREYYKSYEQSEQNVTSGHVAVVAQGPPGVNGFSVMEVSMRGSPLDHFCKLYRANEHLQLLDKELAVFLQPDCYEIVNEFEDDGEILELPGLAEPRRRGIMRRRVIFKKRPPLLRWGTIIGDAIQNLRSALDHIVYTISYRSNSSGFMNDETTEFPICDNFDALRGPHRRTWGPFHQIRGIPKDAQAIIEGLQPYHRGKESLQADPLWILREMSNIDKHRTIHPTGWTAHSIYLDITQLAPGVRIHRLWSRPIGAIENNAILAEVEYSAPLATYATMYMDKEFLFTIAFDQDTPLAGQQVQVALWNLAVYVEGVLNALEPFVPRRIKR
jgi:hypothetical protein